MTNHSTSRRPAATIDGLLRQLQERRLSRRGFVRSAVLLGLSAGAAELLSACAVDQTAPGIPTPTYSAPSARATTATAPGRTRSESQPTQKTVRLAMSSSTTDQVNRLMYSVITDARLFFHRKAPCAAGSAKARVSHGPAARILGLRAHRARQA